MAKLSAEQVAEHYQAELIGADDIGDLAELIAEQAAEIEEWRAQWRSLNTHWLGISEEYSTEQAIEELQHKLREQGARIKELESDAAVGRLVRAKLASGNSVPVERCVIRASEIASLDAARTDRGEAELIAVPKKPSDAMLDRAVAFALNISIDGQYRWTDYMRDLWARFIDEPQTMDDLRARAVWHQQQAAECFRQIGEAP